MVPEALISGCSRRSGPSRTDRSGTEGTTVRALMTGRLPRSEVRRRDARAEHALPGEHRAVVAHPGHGAVGQGKRAPVARPDSARHARLQAEPCPDIRHQAADAPHRRRHGGRSAHEQPVARQQLPGQQVRHLLGRAMGTVFHGHREPAGQAGRLRSGDRLQQRSRPLGLEGVTEAEQDHHLRAARRRPAETRPAGSPRAAGRESRSGNGATPTPPATISSRRWRRPAICSSVEAIAQRTEHPDPVTGPKSAEFPRALTDWGDEERHRSARPRRLPTMREPRKHREGSA